MSDLVVHLISDNGMLRDSAPDTSFPLTSRVVDLGRVRRRRVIVLRLRTLLVLLRYLIPCSAAQLGALARERL